MIIRLLVDQIRFQYSTLKKKKNVGIMALDDTVIKLLDHVDHTGINFKMNSKLDLELLTNFMPLVSF